MLRIGNSNIKPITIKVLVFLIILPALFIVYNLSTFSYTREDYEDDLSEEQKLMFQIMEDEKEEYFKAYSKDAKRNNIIGTIVGSLIYLTIAGFIIIATDKGMRNTQAGRFAGQYVKWEFMEMFKEKKREYEIKDLAHEEVVGDYEHRRKMKEVEHLKEMAEINLKNHKGSIDEARAYLIRYASMYAAGMTDRWRSYVFASAMGSKGTPEEDKDLEDEINRVKADLEREKVRKENIDNNDRQRKANENI